MSQNQQPLNITVLISGEGTNLQALIDAQDESSSSDTDGKIKNARITHVISNRKNAHGLTRAQQAHIPTTYHNLVAYKKKEESSEAGIQKAREAYDRDLAEIIISKHPSAASKPDLVVCAGWMHILSDTFIDALHAAGITIINLHPALPGQFNGAEAIQRAYAAYQRGEIVATGVMVHHVIGEVDMGEPILVKEVKCVVGESESDLEARIHEIEWTLIVDATVKVLGEIEDTKKKS